MNIRLIIFQKKSNFTHKYLKYKYAVAASKFKIAILLPNLKNFIKSTLQPALDDVATATTFVAEPIIVILPPRQDPKDKAHQKTFTLAKCSKLGTTVFMIFEKVAAFATFPKIDVKIEDNHIIEIVAVLNCPVEIATILSPINLIIPKFSIPFIITKSPMKKNKVSHSMTPNIFLGSLSVM